MKYSPHQLQQMAKVVALAERSFDPKAMELYTALVNATGLSFSVVKSKVHELALLGATL